MALSRVVSKIFNVEKCRDLEIGVKGHSRSLKVVPFDRACVVSITAPMKGFPVEFGIGVRVPKCLNDGPTRWYKKFSDRFSRFDTILAVTDSQRPSQPATQPRCRSYYAQR